MDVDPLLTAAHFQASSLGILGASTRFLGRRDAHQDLARSRCPRVILYVVGGRRPALLASPAS